MGRNKHVVFDVVGTCISYDNFFEAIEERLGDRLRKHNVGARLFGYCWMEAGEREYTYLSLSGRYSKFFDIFRSIFYRTLWQAGIQKPREFASDDDREYLLQSYRSLKARPGLGECWDKLRKAGFRVWCLTAGDVSRVGGYLKAAGVEMPEQDFISCDEIGTGKPEPSVYKYVLDKIDPNEREMWFATAHMWDAAGAKQMGFRCAWCSVWEKEPCPDIFGAMEVEAPDLPAMADGITAHSGK